MPEVSVIMGSHNSGRYLAEAIDSVKAQEAVDWELVVVDNGSSDNSAKIVRQLCPADRLQLVVEREALGPAGALRRAVELARAPLLAVLDSDDVARPRRLTLQRDFLATRPAIGLVAGRSEIIDELGNVGELEPAPGLHEEIAAWTHYTHTLRHSTFMFRREIALTVPYRDEVAIASDHDFLARMVEVTRVACLPDIVCGYRVHRESVSKAKRAESAAGVALVQMTTRRRRRQLPEDLEPWRRRFVGLVGACEGNVARAHAACAREFWREGEDDLAAFHAWQSWRAGPEASALLCYVRATLRGLRRGSGGWGMLVRGWLKEPAHVMLRLGGVPDRLQF